MERIEDLKIKIKYLENKINLCYICLCILSFIIAMGAIITHSKIKELADFTLWADKILRAII